MQSTEISAIAAVLGGTISGFRSKNFPKCSDLDGICYHPDARYPARWFSFVEPAWMNVLAEGLPERQELSTFVLIAEAFASAH